MTLSPSPEGAKMPPTCSVALYCQGTDTELTKTGLCFVANMQLNTGAFHYIRSNLKCIWHAIIFTADCMCKGNSIGNDALGYIKDIYYMRTPVE